MLVHEPKGCEHIPNYPYREPGSGQLSTRGRSDRGHLHQLNIHMMTSDRNKYWSNRRVQLQCASMKRRLIVNVSGGDGDDGREQRGKLGKGGCNHEGNKQKVFEVPQATSIPIQVRATSRRGCSAAIQRTRYKAASS